MNYAESQRSIQTLRELWNHNVSKTLWENVGGLQRIQQAEILFSFVREFQKRGFQTRESLESKEVCESVLRSMWGAAQFACSSLRPKSNKQFPRESTDTMQMVPQLPPRDSKAPWQIDSWEDGLPRVAHGVEKRLDRLKGLGNAVVPQIPEIIGRAIMTAPNQRERA